MKLFKALSVALVVAAVAASFIVYPMLPGTVPTHWNAAGQVDGYGPAWMGAFMFPLITR